jgi:hypothetical protein
MSGLSKSPVDVNLSKELQELKKELKSRDKTIEELEIKTKLIGAPTESPDIETVIKKLQEEVDQLRNSSTTNTQQPSVIYAAKEKSKYTDPKPSDIVAGKEAATFISRCVTYVVPSYIDDDGIEHLAPHKLIVFRYSASDIRKDGKEDSIINFCQYTTKLKTEIDFLRAHPQYGLMFSESMTDVASFDHKEYEFKAKVAEDVGAMSAETIHEHAKIHNIANREKLSVTALRHILANEFTKGYVQEAKELQRKRILEMKLKEAV